MPIDSKFGDDGQIVQQVISTTTPTASGSMGELQWNFNDIMAADANLVWDPDLTPSKLTVTGQAEVTSNLAVGGNVALTTGNISTGGNLTIGGTTDLYAVTMRGHIIPPVDNTVDIGSAEKKIRDIYVSEGSLWVGDQSGVGSSGGKLKFKNRKATAPIRIETITSGAQRTFTAKLSSADAVNAQRFHDEFDGQLAGVTYEIENLAKTEKDTFALVSYTAEDTTTPGGPYPANVVLDPDTTAGETIFAAHSAGDQYNIFMNMNAVATNRADGKLSLQSIEGPAEEGQVLKGGPSGGLLWGKHHGDGSIPQDNNKAPASPGTPGELAIGLTGGQWFLYVCVMPNQWTRTPLTLGW